MSKKEEPIAWITRGGKHIPIFADEPSNDEKKKDREIAENKKQADEKNGNTERTQLRTKNGVVFYQKILFKGKEVLYLEEIKVANNFRNKGEGTKLLDEVKSIADKSEMSIVLDAFPVGKGAMSIDQLINWYKKRGFKDLGANQMIYYPKKRN